MAELDVWAAIRALKAQLDRLTSFEWPLYAVGTWTPTWTNLTVVGVPTYTGKYVRVGSLAFFIAIINAGGAITTASTAGSTRINNLPFVCLANFPSALIVTDNLTSNHGIGNIPYSGINAYTPTWAATNNTIIISGWYMI